MMDDDALLTAVASGDDQALRTLFERHAPWVAGRLRRGMPAGTVEDVLQETFLAVWRGAPGYHRSGEAGAWIWGIARRQAAGADSSGPLGAVDAVWAVTDAFEPTGEAASILAAAGVAFNRQRFEQTPHLGDPNAAGAGTAAVTAAGVLPTIASDSSPPPERLGSTDLRAPRLEYAALAKRRRACGCVLRGLNTVLNLNNAPFDVNGK